MLAYLRMIVRSKSMEDYSAKLTAEPFLYNETKTIAKVNNVDIVSTNDI